MDCAVRHKLVDQIVTAVDCATGLCLRLFVLENSNRFIAPRRLAIKMSPVTWQPTVRNQMNLSSYSSYTPARHLSLPPSWCYAIHNLCKTYRVVKRRNKNGNNNRTSYEMRVVLQSMQHSGHKECARCAGCAPCVHKLLSSSFLQGISANAAGSLFRSQCSPRQVSTLSFSLI